MHIQPIQPNKPQPSFGIYRGTRITSYGKCISGRYRGYNIEIYDDKQDKAKLYYVSDNAMKWVKSKLVYLDNGIKKITRSRNNGM